MDYADAVIFLVPIVGSVAFFSYLAILSYASERRREREAYYRHELYRKAVETHGVEALDRVQQMVREDATNARRGRRDGARGGGLVLAGLGVGLLIGLRWVGNSVFMVGAIPLAIGIALFALSAMIDTGGGEPTRKA